MTRLPWQADELERLLTARAAARGERLEPPVQLSLGDAPDRPEYRLEPRISALPAPATLSEERPRLDTSGGAPSALSSLEAESQADALLSLLAQGARGLADWHRKRQALPRA
jgi:hypothetical protein